MIIIPKSNDYSNNLATKPVVLMSTVQTYK